jgi:hypothetical protein
MLAMLFKQFKMILRLGGDPSEWQQNALDSNPAENLSEPRRNLDATAI